MMTTANSEIPQLPLRRDHAAHLPLSAPVAWLRAGLTDTFHAPLSSLAYGFMVFVISALLVGGFYTIGLDYILFPALSGFMVMGPAIAIGLYEKSRLIGEDRSISLASMIMVKAKSPGQILFVGVILMLVLVLWLRAAFLLYALFFGMLPFAGIDQIIPMILTTPRGWGLLVIGTATGGLFAAFSFAISAFSIPMLMNERTDAFTAMGTSMAFAWANKGVVIVWGALVVALFAVSLATALVGLILVFPVLGHGTWHAYRAITKGERLFDRAEEPA